MDKCRLLGACAPWLEPDGDFSRVGVHCLAEGAEVVQSARDFVAKVVALRGAGLSAQAAFLVLQAFSQGHVNHLLRANYEDTGWAREFDGVILQGVESLVQASLDEGQQAQCFLKLAEGGLGLGSAEQVAEAAFLGSWALTLKSVASVVGVSSWSGFQSRCGPVASELARAERKLIEDSGGAVQPVDWVGLLSEPWGKLQGVLRCSQDSDAGVAS